MPMVSTLPKAPVKTGSIDETSAAIVLDQVNRGYLLIDEAVIALADADAMVGIAKLVAKRLSLGADTVLRALDATSEEPSALVCRAAGININGFSAVLRMRRRRQHGADQTPSEALTAFQALPLETARRVVRTLKMDEAG
jgi:hypothetical protein